MRKLFKKETDPNIKNYLALNISQLAKSIKKRITKATKDQIVTKMSGKNPRSFWNTVARLEEKKDREIIELEINGSLTTDATLIAEEFSKFFKNKVENLSNQYGRPDYNIGPSTFCFTVDDVKKASKLLRSKLCCGEDGLPLRIVRNFKIRNSCFLLRFINKIPPKGMPRRWQTALITPCIKMVARHQ